MISRETAEKRFREAAISSPNHALGVVAWEGPRVGVTYVNYSCTCGWGQSWPINQNGTIPVVVHRQINRHITRMTAQEEGVESEPKLIGSVIRPKVTYQYWAAHFSSDLVEATRDKKRWSHGNRWWPWCVVIRNSLGYRTLSASKTEAEAIRKAIAAIERQRLNGYETEILYDEPDVGVEAPALDFGTIVKRLIVQMKEVKNLAPHEYVKLREEVDDAIAQIGILEQLRDELNDRIADTLKF